MFWNTFYKLCTSFGKKPLQVVKELSIATGIITKWKNGTIPNGETLMKLSGYFNCSVDYLLGRVDNVEGEGFTEKEKRLITAYRNKPEMQGAVDRLLDLNDFEVI